MSEQRIRSVQFIDNYFPVIDGVTETVHHYAVQMGAAVVCPEMESHYLEKHTFPYRVIPSRTIRGPMIRYPSAVPELDGKLAREIARENPQILHFHSPSLLGGYAAALGRKMKIPVIGTFHSMIYEAVLEVTKSKPLAKIATDRAVRVYERCDEVWACSEETGETLRSYGFRKPYFVMPNGTEVTVPENLQELKEQAAARFPVPPGKHVLLFVGQMIWYKNQRLILDAFRMLCDRSEDWFLMMVGTGKDEQEIARYAASLRLTEKQVCFTGQVRDRELLTGIYLNADMLFFPSVFDNAPLVLREAAVLAVPTLVTEGSNAAGAIRKNYNGFAAEGTPQAMSSEILRIFAEEDLRETGKKAQETIPLSWEKLAVMVQERYRTVIDRYDGERRK